MRIIDPEYAKVLETNAPLPYFSLSHLLTLFSHDAPTLSQIQHIFDYLLCRDPSASIYIAAQLLLEKRAQIVEAFEDDDDGSLHTILSSWPFVEAKPEIQKRSLLLHYDSISDNPDRSGGRNTPTPSLEDQLIGLLKRSDQLRSLYPRSLPELEFQLVFGRHSIFNTWSQDPACLPSNELAEEVVLDLDSIVSPYTLMPNPEDSLPKKIAPKSRGKGSLRKPLTPGITVAASALFVLYVAIALYKDRSHFSSQLAFVWSKLNVWRNGSWVRRLYR